MTQDTTVSAASHAQMRAIGQESAGGAEVLTLIEVDRPVPGPTEVRVRVYAAGVNPTDWKRRACADSPSIPGFDVSGVVDAVGPGVTVFAPGDEVFGMPRFPHPAAAYAEYVTAPARHFAAKPAGIDHVHAAALPLAALTAWQALVDTADVQPGQRVLIHAAAGGVGHLAVQIAKARGAYVIGTARRAKHQFLFGLGVDEAIDYTQIDFTETAADIDVVLDTIGGDYTPRSLRTLRHGGVLVSLLPMQQDFPVQLAEELGVHAKRMLVEPDQAGMRAIAALVEEGHLHAEIDSVFPLADAAKAHQRGETNRASGKIVLSLIA